MTESKEGSAVATLGGGCFWCLEVIYRELRGVRRVESGFSGGDVKNPSYREVCGGKTGHAEVVQITFDPGAVSFEELLQVFFTMHDPTTLNRQGGDVGPQYRSAIFTHDEGQRETALKVMAAMTAAAVWPDPLVTEVVPFTGFYGAGEEHEDYYARNGGQPYCQAVIAPKVVKFRKQFLEKLRDER